MSENQEKQKKLKDIFTYVKVVKEEAKKEIQKRKNQKDIKEVRITRDEQNIIIEEVAKRPSTKIKVAGALVAGMLLGAGSMSAANNLLDAPKGVKQNKEEITIDAKEADKEININNVTNSREIFINGLKVNVDGLNVNNESQENDVRENQTLRADVIEEIDNLETAEDVLKYIKDIYLEEYNEKNNTEYTAEDVKINRRTEQFVMYADQAQNGDEIIRETRKQQYREKGEPGRELDTQIGEIYAVLKNGEESKKEAITPYNGEYKTVYSDDEEVLEDRETVLASVGEIFDQGIQYLTALRNPEGNSPAVIGLYKDGLIEAVVEYKELKTKEISNSDNHEVVQSNIDEGQEVE